jgi:hypothetical protein
MVWSSLSFSASEVVMDMGCYFLFRHCAMRVEYENSVSSVSGNECLVYGAQTFHTGTAKRFQIRKGPKILQFFFPRSCGIIRDFALLKETGLDEHRAITFYQRILAQVIDPV